LATGSRSANGEGAGKGLEALSKDLNAALRFV